MSKHIDTLITDIYKVLETQNEITKEDTEYLTSLLVARLAGRLGEDESSAPTLRMSNLGQPCKRKLWLSINSPTEAEKLPGHTLLKFLFGDILEVILIFLAKKAGHTVTGEQGEVELSGIKGHRDCIIDGRLVDIKSATTASMKKFRDNKLREDDPFGYLGQLNGYFHASKDELTDKNWFSFLAVDKQLGHLVLDTYEPDKQTDYLAKVEEIKQAVARDTPPERAFEDQPEGASGNRRLCVNCSYCEHKHICWPGLRTFLYATGPVFFTEVKKEPKVSEVGKETGRF